MKKQILGLVIALAMITLSVAAVNAQTTSLVPASNDPVFLLPRSDMVVVIDVRRLLTEAVPRVLAKSPATLTEMNAALDKFKSMSGVDARMIERVAIGVRNPNLEGINRGAEFKEEIVAIVRGRFNAGALIAASRLALGGQYEEEARGGRSLYIFAVNEKMKSSSLRPAPSQIAMTTLDSTTIAVGTPTSVRATIDALSAGSINRAAADIVAFATTDPNMLIGVGVNVESLMKVTLASSSPSSPAKKGLQIDPIDKFGSQSYGGSAGVASPGTQLMKDLEAIKEVYFSAGMTATDFELMAMARTDTEEHAGKLRDMISGFQQFAGAIKDKSIQKALDGVKIVSGGNEIKITARFAQTDVASFVQTAAAKKQPAAPQPVTVAGPTKQPGPKRRRGRTAVKRRP